MDLRQYFTTKYLFEVNRVMQDKTDKLYLFAGIVMVALAILFKVAAIMAPTPVDKKYREKFYALFLTIGLAEIVWFGASYQNVRLFGVHFVAMLILFLGLIWLVWLIVKIIKNYRREKREWEKEQVKLKYLPK